VSDNRKAIEQLVALAPNSITSEKLREIDLSDLGEKFASVKLSCVVNPPAIWCDVLRQIVNPDDLPRKDALRVLQVFLGESVRDALERMVEPLLYAILRKCVTAYFAEWDELKNSRAQ
jgi:hypothetical protein